MLEFKKKKKKKKLEMRFLKVDHLGVRFLVTICHYEIDGTYKGCFLWILGIE